MTKISIITPIYNVESYLKQCLDSIVNQTLKDIEIILVNDGSTDSSGLICDEYAKKDSRIKVIHKNNEGLGKAYNVGLEASSGEYIGIVEADDFIEPIMFENLYNLAQKNNADIVKSSWFLYWENNNKHPKDTQLANFNSWEVFNIKERPEILQIQFSIWSAIYKREFLKQKNIEFLNTPGASFQDVSFTYKAFSQAERIVFTPDAYHYYRQDNMNSSVKSKDKVDVIFNEYIEVDKFFDKNQELKNICLLNKLIKQYYDYKWNFGRIDEKYKDYFINRVSTILKKYIQENEIPNDLFKFIPYEEFNSIIKYR